MALVEGVEIKYKEIPEEQAIFLFKLSRDHEPKTEEEMMEVEKERMNEEKKLVARWIRGIIFDKQKERFGIKVTEKELVEKWNILYNEVDFDDLAKQTRDYYKLLLHALKAAYENGEDKDVVYNKLLVDKMPKLEWEIHHNYYRTPEMRKALEDVLKITAEDLRKPDTIRGRVEREKMNGYIDQEISNTDSEFAEYKNLLEKDPQNKKLQQFDPYYLRIKRDLWWQEQYKKAKIEIKDDRFKDVLQMLIPTTEEGKNMK